MITLSQNNQLLKLEKLFTPIAKELGAEIIDLLLFSEDERKILRLNIECEKGVNLSLCGKLSRQISLILDVEEPFSFEYTLEVSSPGIFRELKKEKDFIRFVGERVKVTFIEKQDDQKNAVGNLQEVAENYITINIDGENFKVEKTNIKKAQLFPNI